MKKIIILLISCLVFGVGISWFLTQKMHNCSSKVTIQFASWGSDSELKILKPILAEFENKNPNIKIEFLHIPQNYFQKIHLLFASNMPPDVIFINNQYLPIYANAGVLEELNNYNDISTNDFYTKSLDALTYQNKLYALPRDISTLVIFYNKNIFDKYKVKYPNENWTYDEFLETSKKLTHLPDVFGISFEEEPYFYLPYLMSFGEKNIPKYKNKTTQKGLQRYADLRNKYHVAPRKPESASATMAQLFLQGKLAMHLSGRWLVPKYRQDAKFEWDITTFPKGDNGSIVPLDASGWAIAKNSKHKKEALILIKYLSSKNSIEKFTQSGLIVPARIDVATSESFLDNKAPSNSKVFLDSIENAIPTPVDITYKEKMDDLKKKTENLFNEK